MYVICEMVYNLNEVRAAETLNSSVYSLLAAL